MERDARACFEVDEPVKVFDCGRFECDSGLAYAEDFQSIAVGVILMPIVIPWGYVYRHYVRQRGDLWR